MPDVTWNGLSYSRPIFWWTKLALLRVALALRKVNFVNRNIQALNKPTLPCCELCIQFCFNASAWAPGTSQSLVNSSCALPPPPPGYCRAFAGPVRPEGGAFAKFALPGAGHLPTPRFWHARGFLSEWLHRGFYLKSRQIGLICSYSRLSLNGHLELVPAFLYSFHLTLYKEHLVPVPKVSVLERVDCICQGCEKNEKVCKGMFSILCMYFFIAYQARIT